VEEKWARQIARNWRVLVLAAFAAVPGLSRPAISADKHHAEEVEGERLPAAAPNMGAWPSSDVLYGEEAQITLVGLPPSTEVEIEAERSMNPGWPAGAGVQLYKSSARFATDASGGLNLASTAPLSGSYSGVDPMGLFWSMSATSEVGRIDRYPEVRLTASIGGQAVATMKVNLHGWAPEVRTENVAAFPGALFASLPGSEARPVLILLHGSDGGTGMGRVMAPMFASRGYAVLSLPYYSPPDQSGRREIEALPGAFADIPIDRLEQARAWLARKAGVDASRIGLWGYSKGGEFALLGAAHFPWIRSVVASVPSDVVWEGWGPGVFKGTRSGFSYRGKPLPFVSYDYSRPSLTFRAFMDEGRAKHPERAAAARIKVERFKGDVLVAGSAQDRIWASAQMAQNIAERRAEAALPTTLLLFADAGHGLTGDPFYPKGTGAAAEAESKAQRRMWKETFAFFERTLMIR
jgi:dienelactone hydrolase